ncbi:hypothetical protein QBC32DRAFT_224889 [Pseudoneurospora amorphoporcata]|uniref:Uncharacterized protein n=1 Tax=Pseudoneurospora amorphoporcata TaxID=241081 RepID=A0AAN6NNW9_9PEZI|nr:hypothetical protein QBC32DRAFT_224889 [Pseudoneurospora amorphoporcata]
MAVVVTDTAVRRLSKRRCVDGCRRSDYPERQPVSFPKCDVRCSRVATCLVSDRGIVGIYISGRSRPLPAYFYLTPSIITASLQYRV